METLDRFIAACVTGEPRKAVSFPGFCALYGNWPDAFRRIVELGTVHPEAQAGFLDTWRRAPTCAPCKINQWKFKEGEFILDPRGLEYEREPDRPQEWWDDLRLR